MAVMLIGELITFGGGMLADVEMISLTHDALVKMRVLFHKVIQ